MFGWRIGFAIAGMLLLAGPMEVNALTAVKPLDGYACMNLTLSDDWLDAHPNQPPVFAGPTESSRRVGWTDDIVFVAWPLHEVNGFVEILRRNQEKAWIQANLLRPWRSKNGSNVVCVPALMSNGIVGQIMRPGPSAN